MATGFYLFRGDKTTCGGIIVGGYNDHLHFGRAIVCEGHKVTCGKHQGFYYVAGGIRDTIHGKRVAGTLHSLSSCPCKSRFIPSIFTDTYQFDVKTAKTESSKSLAPVSHPEPSQYAQSGKRGPQSDNDQGVDAGFAVIPYGGTTEGWQRLLFTGKPPEGAIKLFSILNGKGQEFKAGSIMLIVDPAKQDDEQIAHMQAAKKRIDLALEPLTHQEANFLHKHYATIANFSSIADKGIGLAADPVGKYFENIEKILKDIQETYKNTYLVKGALIGEQFHVKRAQLFNELDQLLKVGFLNKSMKLGEYTKIKHALGLSTRSITHKWNETGIKDIEGYATHIERAAKYVKAMRYTGYVGIAFSAIHSMNEIHEACAIGREDECTKKKYTEIGSFAGGVGGGVFLGSLAAPLCIAIGISTAGTGGLICTILAGGTLGYAGSEVGSWSGEKVGNSLYNYAGNNNEQK